MSALGWEPVSMAEANNDAPYANVSVMSVGFLLSGPDDAVIWRGPRKNGLIKQFLRDVNWTRPQLASECGGVADEEEVAIDYLVVDTPPGTSDEHLSIVQYLAAAGIDGALLVTTPQEVALQDVRKQLDFCRRLGVRVLGVVENMSSFRCPGCARDTHVFRASTGGALSFCAAWSDAHVGGAIEEPRWMPSISKSMDTSTEASADVRPAAPASSSLPDAATLASTSSAELSTQHTAGAAANAAGERPPLIGRLPLDPQLTRCCDSGRSLLIEQPDSEVALELLRVASRIRSLCENNIRE